ncbi:YciI family protein [Arthrobacter sp. NPDC090010]|uniref:YciI family protein n=1 Tax=Arthrobacter sp. NPDC090010 TaxID=3363942 RepID=UPI0037F5C8AF
MRYTLLLHYQEMTPDELGAEVLEQGQAAMASYAATLQQAGVLLGAEVLQPSHASTTVSRREGKLRIQDGAFADTREQLGGYFVLDVADLDEAIHWAGQAPGADWGSVEIRPGAVHTVDGVWTPNA